MYSQGRRIILLHLHFAQFSSKTSDWSRDKFHETLQCCSSSSSSMSFLQVSPKYVITIKIDKMMMIIKGWKRSWWWQWWLNWNRDQAVIEEVNDRDLEKLVEENDFVAVAWWGFQILKSYKCWHWHCHWQVHKNVQNMWRGDRRIGRSGRHHRQVRAMEFKLDFKNIFHNLRYNIEFVKINNKKYARGWGIRYLYAIIHIKNQSKDNQL